jgi:hypothetical protein
MNRWFDAMSGTNTTGLRSTGRRESSTRWAMNCEAPSLRGAANWWRGADGREVAARWALRDWWWWGVFPGLRCACPGLSSWAPSGRSVRGAASWWRDAGRDEVAARWAGREWWWWGVFPGRRLPRAIELDPFGAERARGGRFWGRHGVRGRFVGSSNWGAAGARGQNRKAVWPASLLAEAAWHFHAASKLAGQTIPWLNGSPANRPLKKGATAGLPSSAARNTRENTAGQASSGTQTIENRLFSTGC